MFAVDAFDFQRKDAFRDACEESGQFERTLLIADEESYVSYLEGCTVHPLVILCIPLSFWKRLASHVHHCASGADVWLQAAACQALKVWGIGCGSLLSHSTKAWSQLWYYNTRLAFGEAAVVELHAAKGAEIKCSKLCLSSLKWIQSRVISIILYHRCTLMFYSLVLIPGTQQCKTGASPSHPIITSCDLASSTAWAQLTGTQVIKMAGGAF